MNITIPELALVVLVGASGAGKSTFARAHFRRTEVLSSDYCRGLISDDENDQSATKDAFEVLQIIAAKRLAAGRLTVVDATNVQPEARAPLVHLARRYHVPAVAIVLDLPERVSQERNSSRPERDFGPHVVRRQLQQLHCSLGGLKREGFGHIFVLRSQEEVAAAVVERVPLWTNLTDEHGPFDIVGDVHGCLDELLALLAQLGYVRDGTNGTYRHPDGRKAVFLGIVYTRTGRRFFDDLALEVALLARLAVAVEQAGHWHELATDWIVLDCELMPWSAKAQELLRRQYAAVGAAATAALGQATTALEQTAGRLPNAGLLLARVRDRAAAVDGYVAAYRRYCWQVTGLGDLKLAPFHLLASEGAVHSDRDHCWHMDTLATLCRADEALLLATPYCVVDLTDATAEAAAIAWWEQLTAEGGEGMVVKPLQFVAHREPATTGDAPRARGLVQPAIKCRGREYLRIIYGPEYTAPEHLERLRPRRLGAKRAMALREFALGLEGLQRFVDREPLRRVHECAFGVLALESEPVDPRL